MKIIYVVRCRDCFHFWETPSDGPNQCRHLKRSFEFEFNESSNIPEWCPLPEDPADGNTDPFNADPKACPHCDNPDCHWLLHG